MNKKLYLLIFGLFLFCKSPKNDPKYRKINDTIGSVNDKNNQVSKFLNLKSNCQYKKIKKIDYLMNVKGEKLPFSLIYNQRDIYKEIKFYDISLMLVSGSYMSFDFILGIKNDSLYTLSKFSNPRMQKLALISFNENKIKRFPREFLYPRKLVVDSLYFQNEQKILEISSTYEMPHGDKPKYTINKIYLSNCELIFKIDVKNNETGEIYTTKRNPRSS